MSEPIREISDQDIMLWPDGTWYYREELGLQTAHLSDDYEVIPYGTSRWSAIVEEA